MTISTTHSVVRAVGNGSNKVFNFDFILYDEGDLVVKVDSVDVDPSEYTVTIDPEDFVGSVMFTTAPVNLAVVELARVLPITQEMEYPAAGAFSAQSHERALDKLTMIAQQQQRIVDEGAQYSPLAGNWQAVTSYKLYQLVYSEDGKVYQCLADHISTDFAVDLAAGLWALYLDVQTTIYVEQAEAAAAEAEAQADLAASSAQDAGNYATNRFLSIASGVSTVSLDCSLYDTFYIHMDRNVTATLANMNNGKTITIITDQAQWTLSFTGHTIRWPENTPPVFTPYNDVIVVTKIDTNLCVGGYQLGGQ